MLVALLAERSDGSDDFIEIKDGDTFFTSSVSLLFSSINDLFA